MGEQKKDEVVKAYHKMMAQLPEAIGSDKLIIANILRARFDDAGLDYLNYFDGSYIEGFEHNVGGMTREEYMAKGIAAIQRAARNVKIIAFTMGMGRNKESEMGIDEARDAVKDFESIRERFNYALAIFLICAEKYSYFMASDGYGIDGGKSVMWMKEIPEYAYPLGAPKGPAIKKGCTYVRHFKHASVDLDIKNERAEISWKQVRLDPERPPSF